ncbi:MAG: hypothetical protein HC919_10395 [Oscillatoriales cyanobacterium SM2_2_1]|nr:hypothetical protein [Oscillatoriales cyanobacterium SM2_2_1]
MRQFESLEISPEAGWIVSYLFEMTIRVIPVLMSREQSLREIGMIEGVELGAARESGQVNGNLQSYPAAFKHSINFGLVGVLAAVNRGGKVGLVLKIQIGSANYLSISADDFLRRDPRSDAN